MWQVDTAVDGMDWNNAADHCSGLRIGGHEDWRLPTVSELRSLIRGCGGTKQGGLCAVTDGCLNIVCWNDPCRGCNSGEGPDGGCYWPSQIGGSCSWYWSSKSVEDHEGLAWGVGFDDGRVDTSIKEDGEGRVRCVR